ncbi:hypothetical protein GRJ2_000830700 [Grus japonensis]|uniref:Uncharacterized protein n=1 Tax=Grus japonensis TaxID=30415 RepID=A0ABC9WFP3_GRUJA
MEDPTLEQVEAPEGGCGPWEAHAGASSWQDLWTRGERSLHQSRFAGRTCDPVGDPHWSSVLLKVCTPWERPTLEQFVKNCSLWWVDPGWEARGPPNLLYHSPPQLEGLTLEKPMEDCLLWQGPHAGAEEECEESSP